MDEFPLLSLLFLLGFALITGVSVAIMRLGKAKAEEIAKGQRGAGKTLFKRRFRDPLSFCMNWVKVLLILAFVLVAYSPNGYTITAIVGLTLLGDFIPRLIALWKPRTFLNIFLQLTTLYLLPFWLPSLGLFKFFRWLSPKTEKASSTRIKDRILEILHDAEFAPYLDPQDQKLILSVVSFKERIAREIMVPRVDMFTLSAETSVEEATEAFLEEEYSRIPVWKESMDNIIGAIYYKDLLNLYFSHDNPEQELASPIERLIKPIVYTPETKKISHLLQEFRNKQIHLAIVVDEYGGTEGIVTIEDILEELVGEIADEYDSDEEALYFVLPSGGWIVDAKMTILDIDSELGVTFPQHPEYDTLGGYIFHKAGSIPKKGWRLHEDEFDLEILSSSERMIERVRVIPLSSSKER